MDLRKIVLTFLALTGSITIFAQLNPIKNLYFSAWYQMPNNFFELNWSPPDTTTSDTLIGYNVYRGNILYRFQTDTTMHHLIIQDTDAPESFLGGDGIINPPFYIHVTAVYNLSNIESLYNDSSFCYGLAINVNENKSENIKLEIIPNPTKENSIIAINLEENHDGEQLLITDEKGVVIQRVQLTTKNTKIRVSNLSFKSGIYFCTLITKSQIVTKKFIIQE